MKFIRLNNVEVEFALERSPTGQQTILNRVLGIHNPRDNLKFRALHDVNLEISEGDRLGLIGRNGAGKTTLLKVISGILPPSTGTVNVSGQVNALLNLGTGMDGDLSGYETIYVRGSLLGIRPKEMDVKAEEIVNFANIGEFIHQPVSTYSAGMFLRLGFAIATAIEPEILVLDEVYEAGDAAFKERSRIRIESFIARGNIVVLATHSTASIVKYCNKVAWLEKGTVVKFGSARDVVPLFQEGMGITPSPADSFIN
ncbi:MAG: ATP-binding cassette domain-containing protein [Alphaproteobacteria bacterium]|nr:ATP-binding cassette domain-containing protein [Alphaproteobacteria bacterium]